MNVSADNFFDGGFTPLFYEIVRFNENEKEGFSSQEEAHPRHPGLTARKKELWL